MGIVFHLAFLWSIFDIYFVSPLVHGMQHHRSTETAPAKRLFLVVGDGLRADKCFLNITHPTTGKSDYLAPFIRSKVLTEGTFGVSHTRMPTESRPGHVAIIAGFYEDVSAVTKGWKENPVDFDSVFNQSSHTYSYGSPDILPMFAQGASDKKRVDAVMYGSDYEDFTKSSIELDQFVFDNVKDLFARAKIDPQVNVALRQEKLVFFLHLLGIDTAGHSYRPYSAEYYDNIKYIDTQLRELEQLVENFYADDKTAWVFTADHGMSDLGSHGDGHPDNTRTPLVAWGAGVAKPVFGVAGDHDEFSEPWELGSVKRNDVNQADIAPLMSYLIGTNYPANSVGELPLDFVQAPDSVKTKALYANALEVIEQYLVKENQRRQAQIRFVPFAPLSEEQSIAHRVAEIEKLVDEKAYSTAIDKSDELMKLGLQGLRYLQTYNWLFLRILVTMGFLGWIAYSTTSFLHLFVAPVVKAADNITTIRTLAIGILSVLCGLLFQQQSPLNYYLYAIFPVFFWEQAIENRTTISVGLCLLVQRSSSPNRVTEAVGTILFGIALMESIVCGYFYREVFSLCFGVAAMWPWIHNASVAMKNFKLSLLWAFLCIVLASFTVLPVDKQEDIIQIAVGGIIMSLISLYHLTELGRQLKLGWATMVLSGIQLGLIILSIFVTVSSVSSLKQRKGLPLGNQVTGWATLVLSLVSPFFHALYPVRDYRFRLLTIFMAFSPSFVVLTISYEGLFYVAFFAILLVWLEFEYLFYSSTENGNGSKERELSLADFRISLFFFFLSQVGFFGTGNIASISSFSLDSVRRLIPIFDPFSMGAILIFKILVPFAVLSVCLGILNLRLGVPKSALFSMVLAVSDILSLNFFYLVVDEGSWLDIGTGISHFSISSLLCVFMILLEYLSDFLVRGVKLELTTAETVAEPTTEKTVS